MAKKGIKEPAGSENWPVFDRSCRKEKGEKGYVPCYWENHGKSDREASNPTVGSTKKYRENYDKIRWEK